MYSINNLYDRMMDKESMTIRMYEGFKHKKKRTDVQKALENPNAFRLETKFLIEGILEGDRSFAEFPHEPKTIYDQASRKERQIIVPEIHEHVIHHMLINVTKPLYTRGMIDNTFSSISGRGLHRCSKYIRNKIDHEPAQCKYFLQTDIHHFFATIDHDILKDRLERHICDKKVLKLLFAVIDTVDDGLPIGFYTSHWLANWFLQPLDHLLQEKYHAHIYARYMDDMLIGGPNKRHLHNTLEIIEAWLDENHMSLKPNYQIRRFDYIDSDGNHHGEPIDFVGFQYYRDRTKLRDTIFLKFKRKAAAIGRKGYMTIYDARQMQSYLGWLRWADIYEAYLKYVAPNIKGISKCSQYISQYSKRQMHTEATVEVPGEAIVNYLLLMEKEVA